jgi:hypothetical protein
METGIWILILAVILIFGVSAILYKLLYSPNLPAPVPLVPSSREKHMRGYEDEERPNYLISGLIILLFALFALMFVFRCKGKKFV